jgi:hypothetical protein
MSPRLIEIVGEIARMLALGAYPELPKPPPEGRHLFPAIFASSVKVVAGGNI